MEMRLSTLTQRSEIKATEQRLDIATPIAVIALVAAVALAFGGHWLAGLAVAAAGGVVFLNTAIELRALGDPRSTEAFYRLADPRQPLDLPDARPGDAPGAPRGEG
jgi:hypothetical protein